MRINIAHVREQGINFVVAEADAISHTDPDRAAVLSRVTAAARSARLRVDKAALAFTEGGRITFFGTPDLVRFLSRAGLPRWTHQLDLD